MKKGTKIFVFIFLGLILAGFLISVVSAAIEDPNTWGASIKSTIKAWGEGKDIGLSPNVLKVLFFILIALLVYSAFEMSGMIKSGFTMWAIAIVVSFIATAYITPEQFYALGTEYGVMGLTLSAFLPFLILSFFTLAAAKQPSADKIFLDAILWWFFFIFLLIRTISIWVGHTTITKEEAGTTFYLVVITFGAGAIALFNKSIVNFLIGIYEGALTEASSAKFKEATATLKNLSKMQRSTAEDYQI